MTNQQSAKLTQPRVGSFHDPAPFVAPQFAPILVPSLLIVVAVGHDQIDPPLLQPLSQRIGIVAAIGNYAPRLLPGPTSPLRDADFRQRGFRKLNFRRRGTFQPNSQRKTLTVDQYHPLCALATLGFTHGRAPFFAEAKLPSRKVSSHFSNPSVSRAPSRTRHASSQMPSSCHRCSRRQQVAGEGNSSGRNRQAAPVCRIHRMPSKQGRFGVGGRPRLSRRRLGFGKRGSISSHCLSVNSFCRAFMTEAHQLTCLRHKYLI